MAFLSGRGGLPAFGNFRSRFVRFVALGALLFITACVVTTERSYFGSGDFAQPKLMGGDWISAPGDPSNVQAVRITPNGSLWRAQALTRSGDLVRDEKPVDFGLVDLGHGWYLVVQCDSKGTDGPVNYLGLELTPDKLNFYVFSGGKTPKTQAMFDALVASLGMGRDPAHTSEARLTGNIRKAKLRTLFRMLLADPAAYDAQPSVFVRMNARGDRDGKTQGGRRHGGH